jgi:hypothetical protein
MVAQSVSRHGGGGGNFFEAPEEVIASLGATLEVTGLAPERTPAKQKRMTSPVTASP